MKLNLQGGDVVITPFGLERGKLEKFPGLYKRGPYFFMPAEPRLVYNIVNRLKRKFESVELDSGASMVYSADFKLKPLPTDFKFFTKPKVFQEIALRYLYSCGGGGLLLEPGMGKTKIILDFIALMGFKKACIICPLPLLFVWQEEQLIHRPDKSIHLVETTEWEDELSGIMAADIVVMNYAKAQIFAEKLFFLKFDFVGIDEALIKDPQSLRTKYITTLGTKISHRALMSGTLVNNTPLDMFAPVRFLEPVLVGTSYTKFKEEYAVLSKGGGEEGTHKFVVGFRKVPEIRSILDTVSIVMTKDEWLKLPPKKFIDVGVQISDEQRDFYQSLQSNYIATTPEGDTVEFDNPLVALSKLIQVSNGFVYSSPEDESLQDLCAEGPKPKKKRSAKDRKTYFFKQQPKLDSLQKLLTTTLKSRRGIIWFNMAAEYTLIHDRLKSLNIPFLSITGKDKNIGETIKEFNRNPNHLWLVCQARKVNYGVTVLGKDSDEAGIEAPVGVTPEVFTQVFYSMNFSLEMYLQQQDRIHRIGQEHDCEYYRLVANTSAEKNIIEKIDLKLDIRGQVLVDVFKRTGLKLV